MSAGSLKGWTGEVEGVAQDPENASARAWAAQSVMSRWHATTRVAMARAFRLRYKLGDEFPRLANLVVLYAGLLGTRNYYEETSLELKRFTTRYERLGAAFVRRAVPASKLNWSEVSRVSSEAHERLDRKRFPAKYKRKSTEGLRGDSEVADDSIERRLSRELSRHGRTPRVSPGFDLEVLAAGFSWLQNACSTANVDCAHALSFLEGLLSVCLGMLPRSDSNQGPEENDQIEGTPYEFDGWVFDLVVRVIPGLDAGAAAGLWSPILELGPRAHYWVGSFCNSWHVSGLEASPSREEFFGRWREMIAHAEGSPVWSPEPERAHFRLGDLWQHLLGMGLGVRVVGAKENEPFLAQMVPIYERWAKHWLQNSRSFREFCQLLLQAGAKPLRFAALPWLASSLQGLSEYRRHRDDIDDLLIRVLRLTWSDSSNQLAADAASGRVFLELVTLLAADQNADALHLRDAVAKSLRVN